MQGVMILSDLLCSYALICLKYKLLCENDFAMPAPCVEMNRVGQRPKCGSREMPGFTPTNATFARDISDKLLQDTRLFRIILLQQICFVLKRIVYFTAFHVPQCLKCVEDLIFTATALIS